MDGLPPDDLSNRIYSLIMKKVIITAANGFLGKNLAQFLSRNYEVVALVRTINETVKDVKYFQWNGVDPGDWQLEFEDAYAVINLAGRSVNCRYNEENKKQIYASRLESTRLIGEAIESCINPPQIWINSASATIYRHSEDKAMTESEGEEGTGFSVDVCQKWESAFFAFGHARLRQVALRTAIVLGSDGGALKPMVNLVKWGFGGKQGKGNQMFSWVHIDDFCKAVAFVLENADIEGVLNVASPNPLPNVDVMRTLRKVYGAPFGLSMPKILLELGARIIRTETELILKSRYVVPEKLVKHGFIFDFPNIEQAVINLKDRGD